MPPKDSVDTTRCRNGLNEVGFATRAGAFGNSMRYPPYPWVRVSIDEHSRKTLSCDGSDPPRPPCHVRWAVASSPHPLHSCAHMGQKGNKMPHTKVNNVWAVFLTNLLCNIDKRKRDKTSRATVVGQWTSLFLLHELMTTLSKVDCALPVLYPEHSNVAIGLGLGIGIGIGLWLWLWLGIRVRVRRSLRV